MTLGKKDNGQLEQLIEALATTINDGLEQLASELRPSKAGVLLHGADARSLVASNGAGVKVAAASGRIAGFSVRETSGNASALVKLHDGTDTGGDVIMSISLSPGESARDWFWPGGINYSQGLFVEVVNGAIEGCAYIGPR